MLVWLTLFALDAGHRFGAVGILAIVAANTVFLGGFAVFLTAPVACRSRSRRLACAAIFSVWNDNHDVQLVDLPVRRVASRHERGVFVVGVARAGRARQADSRDRRAAEGGGIRAAYWTSLVLHHLADIPDPDVMFPRRLFAISSVSGGSFGAAVYAGLRRDPTSTPPRAEIASAILEERFLAPMVAKWVSGDLLQWFLPIPIRRFDRSSAMETAFAAAYNEHVHHDSMVEKFTEFRPPDADDVPVLLLNSTSVQLGRRIVTSPYPWPLSDVSVEEADPIDFHKLTGRDVSVATAVHNTARFPYISAAGRLRATNGENLGPPRRRRLLREHRRRYADRSAALLEAVGLAAQRPLHRRRAAQFAAGTAPDRSGRGFRGTTRRRSAKSFHRCAPSCRPAPPAAIWRCGGCASRSSR
jgi:hypothetical protein